ncbi:Autophagy-related protein [Mycena indigotica]|uniref:Autophagy-related protein n=1 Tax=Mycena indigotica TaxID=2126181 RepID=A0A8H6SY14_9AGAR|nr:Autophagy-related protein [Mycena indigotica]KAF7307521.1 Autophagy-related protein [Mycena indigotica]
MSRLPAPENPVPDAEPQAHDRASDDYKDSDEVATGGKPSLFVSSITKDEPAVTRRELWSYYLYYNGDNGVGPNGYSATLFQGLAFAAGYDPTVGPGSSCTSESSSGKCVLPWGGGTKSVTSIVLVANGVSFAIMTAIFTTIGSAADYGTFGRWLLFFFTIVCWGAQFASMSLTKPSRWGAAMALYMVGFISYGATLVFYAALFPRLARNTPRAKETRAKYEAGEITKEEYEVEESMQKNLVSNISTAHSNIGYIVTLCLNLSILLPLADNPLVNNYTLVLTNGYWVIVGIWWFIYQQPRPGPPLPKGEHYITIGWKQIWAACLQYKQLPYTFIYLFAFFLLADGLNTTGTLVSICQNDKFHFSFLQNTYLGLSQAITSTLSTFGFWYIQRHWKISTKKMFVVTNVVTIMIPLWGMIGIWTGKLGFHNKWEFWAYNVVFGLFQAPYYAFSQTMMAELTPPGFDNMFFGLFGLSNRASSMIGPNVIQAIIDRSGNNWMGFPFLFSLCVLASLVIWFAVDVEKGRADAVSWAESLRANKYAEGGLVTKE